MNRVSVYIDGFNLYYGQKRAEAIDNDWKKSYWIDFVKLFELFAPHLCLQRVVYFTTPLKSTPKRNQQIALEKANRLLNGNRFEIKYGKFYDKEYICPNCGLQYAIPEEKRTDVNISVQMMRDCALNNTDILFLVSADSDLIPTIKSIKCDYPDKTVTVFFPPQNFSNDINNLMKSNNGNVVRLDRNKGKFIASVMPDIVTVNGKSSTIPPEWKV